MPSYFISLASASLIHRKHHFPGGWPLIPGPWQRDMETGINHRVEGAGSDRVPVTSAIPVSPHSPPIHLFSFPLSCASRPSHLRAGDGVVPSSHHTLRDLKAACTKLGRAQPCSSAKSRPAAVSAVRVVGLERAVVLRLLLLVPPRRGRLVAPLCYGCCPCASCHASGVKSGRLQPPSSCGGSRTLCRPPPLPASSSRRAPYVGRKACPS